MLKKSDILAILFSIVGFSFGLYVIPSAWFLVLMIIVSFPMHEFGHYATARYFGSYRGFSFNPMSVYESPGTWQCGIAGFISSLLLIPAIWCWYDSIFPVLLYLCITIVNSSMDFKWLAETL